MEGSAHPKRPAEPRTWAMRRSWVRSPPRAFLSPLSVLETGFRGIPPPLRRSRRETVDRGSHSRSSRNWPSVACGRAPSSRRAEPDDSSSNFRPRQTPGGRRPRPGASPRERTARTPEARPAGQDQRGVHRRTRGASHRPADDGLPESLLRRLLRPYPRDNGRRTRRVDGRLARHLPPAPPGGGAEARRGDSERRHLTS